MINERAMLVTLNISQWTGRKKDKKVTKETNAFYGAADASGYYSKALIPKEAVKPISQVVSTARTFHYENTLPWGDNGERLLPSKNYLDYTRKMHEFSNQFDDEVRIFLSQYPELIRRAQETLNQMFNQDDYPDIHKLEARFAFSTQITPVPSAADFRVDLAQDEVCAIRSQIEHQTQKAQAEAMGRSPGPGFERAIKDEILPSVNWRVLLQDFVDQAARTDYSWMHPNPRYITGGAYLPSLYTRNPGTIVVAIDTSGSVSDTQLSGFASEVSAILETYDTTLEVVYADRQVRGRESFTRADLPLTLKPEGGGSTDFKPVFELVKAEGVDPCCLVYLTDLCCSSYPVSIPDFPVLWVNTERFRWKEPPFGRVIDME